MTCIHTWSDLHLVNSSVQSVVVNAVSTQLYTSLVNLVHLQVVYKLVCHMTHAYKLACKAVFTS